MPTTTSTETCTRGQPSSKTTLGSNSYSSWQKELDFIFPPSLLPLPTSAGSGHSWRPKYQSRSGAQWHCTWEAGGSGKWHIASACLHDPSIAGSVWIPVPNPHISPTSLLYGWVMHCQWHKEIPACCTFWQGNKTTCLWGRIFHCWASGGTYLS